MLPHHDERTGRALLLKEQLVDGAYYIGRCRNATIARWSAEHGYFFHWRTKFDRIFLEEIAPRISPSTTTRCGHVSLPIP